MMDSKLLVVTKTQYKLEISASVPRQCASTPREVNESPQHFDKNSNQKDGSLTVRVLQATPARFLSQHYYASRAIKMTKREDDSDSQYKCTQCYSTEYLKMVKIVNFI